MPTCFVIQPFDSGKYDKRFEDVYKPAIVAAGLEAYRVDQDTNVDVPIDAIEQGIRAATICLADITTDNPNVWYELGFAFASGRPLVMVCSDERTGKKYPFDIQHRTIIPYQADSPRDFDVLKTAITNRLVSLLKRTDALQAISKSEQIAPIMGLTQPELAVLAAVAGSVVLPEEGVSVWSTKQDIEKAGFTALGFSIGLRRLREKEFLKLDEVTDYNGETSQVILVTPSGWDWVEKNESQFVLRRPDKPRPTPKRALDDDDIPF